METDDVNQELRAAENAMRDYVTLVLSRVHGVDWITRSGIQPGKLTAWQETRDRAVRDNRGIRAAQILFRSVESAAKGRSPKSGVIAENTTAVQRTPASLKL